MHARRWILGVCELKTIQNKSENEAANVLVKARSAILEGGYDDLASAAADLSELIKKQNPPQKETPLSPLIKPLIAIADILSTDRQYLRAAITAYIDAAQYSAGKDDELHKQSMIALLKKTEFLPSSADRIEIYRQTLLMVPAHSPVAKLAKRKYKEQENPVYFRMRSAKEMPKLDEAVIDGDLKAVYGAQIIRVIRQQTPAGEIQYSVVVPRGFSRGKLSQAGVQNVQKLQRKSADDELDRIIVPSHNLPQHTQRDMDFLSRLLSYGIYLDATHGRIRDAAGSVIGYNFPEGANPDRLRYMGVDVDKITPQDGKFFVPMEKINFFADPALIGKWNWMPAGGGIIRSSVPEDERSTIIQTLQTFGITPSDDTTDTANNDYVVVARNDKGKLDKIIHQHILRERSKHLLNFAEALPGFASTIAVAAYKDACGPIFGLKRCR